MARVLVPTKARAKVGMPARAEFGMPAQAEAEPAGQAWPTYNEQVATLQVNAFRQYTGGGWSRYALLSDGHGRVGWTE